MINKVRLPAIAAALGLGLFMTGCASTPQGGDQAYSALYDGGSTTAYGTAFPVATPGEAYRNGDAAAAAGDLDRALFEYIRGLKLDDRPRPDALFRIGAIHHDRGNYRLADLAYRWALRVDPKHVAAGTRLGEVLLHRRQYAQAEEQLRPILASGKAPWRTYNAMGILADLEGDYPQAQQYYQQALAKNPGSPLVLNNLGYSRYLNGDLAGARQALREALSSNPNYELAWRNLGLVHARQGDYEYAVEAVGRDGERAEAYNDVGYIAMLDGRYDEALSFFEQAMHLSPSYYATASENARNLHSMRRRFPGAIADE